MEGSVARPEDNARWEKKQRAAGWVRGPRITGEASERLRTLAYRHRITPAEVVTRLLLGIPLDDGNSTPVRGVDAVVDDARAEFQRLHGFSDSEMRYYEAMGGFRG